MLAAEPFAAVNLPAEALIGEALNLSVTFDNVSATDTGFGPYVDLILPATGADGAGAAADDGVSFGAATYLGSPVSSTVLTFNAAGRATHPFAVDSNGAPLVISGTPGDQLVVLELPFGSFTPDQPPAPINVSAALSNLADVGTSLPIRASAGFRYGNDALNNPSSDPSIVQSPSTLSNVTPTLFRLSKTYIGPEDETATGPNFVRQYRLNVDVADGQTLTNLDLTDVLPNNLQYVRVDGTAIRGTATATTAVGTPSTTTPGGTLTRRFASVTGTTAGNDASLLFSYFVPRDNAGANRVLNPTTGDDVVANDDARAAGNWNPIDSRDPVGPVVSDATTIDHALTAKSIAIQKGVTVVNDVGAPGPSPGDTLEYTLNFQVSDFFAFRDVVVTDVFSDGQRAAAFTPTLSVTEHGATSARAFGGSNFRFNVDSPGTGSTTSTFNLSDELISRGLDGDLLGGSVPDGGTGGPLPSPTPAFGGTTGRVVYRTIIQQNFTDDFPSGDPSVDEGDVLTNNVTIDGALLSTSNLAMLGTLEADASASRIEIVRGSLTKSIYAINGNTGFASPVQVAAGDTVTYRLRYSLPSSDVENLVLDDFLPLPIFNAANVSTFNDVVSAAAPAAGRAKFGPSDTFRALSGIVPTLASNGTSNALKFSYGNYDDPNDTPTAIDLLFTVTVGSDPFADGLFLTNQAQVSQGSTNAGLLSQVDIVMLQLTEPVLRVSKGVVATDRGSAAFTPAAAGPVGFSAPGSLGYRGSGTINSNGLAASPINSDLRGVDAGDRVTFAIVVENTGSGLKGGSPHETDDKAR